MEEVELPSSEETPLLYPRSYPYTHTVPGQALSLVALVLWPDHLSLFGDGPVVALWGVQRCFYPSIQVLSGDEGFCILLLKEKAADWEPPAQASLPSLPAGLQPTDSSSSPLGRMPGAQVLFEGPADLPAALSASSFLTIRWTALPEPQHTSCDNVTSRTLSNSSFSLHRLNSSLIHSCWITPANPAKIFTPSVTSPKDKLCGLQGSLPQTPAYHPPGHFPMSALTPGLCACQARSLHSSPKSSPALSRLPSPFARSRCPTSLHPGPCRPPAPPRGDATHLQLQHFLLLELHPGLSLSGLTGLLLGLQLLLLPRLLPQPRYPGRSKRPRLSGLGSRGPHRGPRPAPPRPPARLSHRSSCSRWFSARFQAISSRCSVASSSALRSARTPARASCIFLRTSDTNCSLAETRPRSAPSARPPAPTLPAAASLSTVSHT